MGTGTVWHDPANWVGDSLPGSADDALIGMAFSGRTIVANQNVTIKSVTSAASIQISGGTFSIASISTLSGLLLSGGHVTGTGDITVAGSFNWTAGWMSGSGKTVVAAAAGTISGTSEKLLGRRLENQGSLTYSGHFLRIGIDSSEPGFLTNLAGATFVASGDGMISYYYFPVSADGQGGVFDNQGTFVQTGSGQFLFNNIRFDNGGAVELQTGRLSLEREGSHTGDFHLAAGTTLWLYNSNTFAAGADFFGDGYNLEFIGGSSTFAGSISTTGMVSVRGGTIVVHGTTSVSTLTLGGGTAILNGTTTVDTLTLNHNFSWFGPDSTLTGSGNVTVTGLLNWGGGIMSGSGKTILAPGVVVAISGESAKLLDRRLDNQGDLTYTAQAISCGAGAVFTNLVGATISIPGDTVLVCRFDNNGTVKVLVGRLTLSRGGNHSGDFELANGTTLRLGGDHSFSTDVEFLGNGFTLDVNTGTSAFNGAVNVPIFALSGGTLTGAGVVTVNASLNWSGGTMSGMGRTILASGANGAIVGASDKYLVRRLDNQGSLTYSGDGFVIGPPSGTEAGVLTNLAGGTMVVTGENYILGSFPSTGNAIVNQGTFVRTGTGYTLMGGIRFDNSGTVKVLQGRLSLGGGNHTGDFELADGVELSLWGDHTFSVGADLVGTGYDLSVNSGASSYMGSINTTGRVFGGGTLSVAGAFSVGRLLCGCVVLNGQTSVGTFHLNGGTAVFNGPTSVGTFIQDFGTLTGAGVVTVTGSFSWSGKFGKSTMSGTGTTIVPGGVSGTISGTTYDKYLGRRLDNHGSLTYDGQRLFFGPPSSSDVGVLTNLPGATFVATGDGDLKNFSVPATGHAVVNHGTFVRSGSGETEVAGVRFDNRGSVQVVQGTLRITGGGSSDGDFHIDAGAETRFSNVRHDLAGATISGPGTLAFSSIGSISTPQLLEASSHDIDNVAAGFSRNLAIGTLMLTNSHLRLVDAANNSPVGSEPEAAYVNNLSIPVGSTVDLNSLHLYTRAAAINGAVLNGTINALADGGEIVLNTPTPGKIALAGETDEWTFFGRADQAVTLVANPGTSVAPAPLAPTLQFVEVSLLDAAGNVLASGSSTTAGQAVTLLGVPLPVDGTYRVRVKAEAGHAANQGNYRLTVWNATADVFPLTLNTQHVGRIETPFSTDRWTFSAHAGQLVRFDLVNATSSGIAFWLVGPGGTSVFEGLTGDSAAVELPTSGQYVISVRGATGQTGAYAFRLEEVSITDLELGTSYHGTFAGSGQAQLFRVAVPAGKALFVSLDDASDVHRNEIYARYGAPPTRADHDARFTAPSAADQELLIPSASAGTWYILVYAESAPTPSTFVLLADARDLHLTDVTPARRGNSTPGILTLTGAGFDSSTLVELLAADGSMWLPTSVVLDSPTVLTVGIDFPSLPAGIYDIRVSKPGSTSLVLDDALTIVQGGLPKLETRLIVPSDVRLAQPQTLWIEYSNTGEVPMPVPLLVLHGDNNALLTTDASKSGIRWFPGNPPSGLSDTVQILAIGATSQPGNLQPGETGRVPVYSLGSRPPFPPNDFAISYTLSVLTAEDRTPIDWTSIWATAPLNYLEPLAAATFRTRVQQSLGNLWGDIVQNIALEVRSGHTPYAYPDIFDAILAAAAFSTLEPSSSSSGEIAHSIAIYSAKMAEAEEGPADELPRIPMGSHVEGVEVQRPSSTPSKTIFVVKGFTDEFDAQEIADARIVAKRNPNARVIVLDWSNANGSKIRAKDYLDAADNVAKVGKEVALWLKNQDIDPAQVEGLGHSLGAQVLAAVSEESRSLNRGRLGAIFAADPAGPEFQGKDTRHRLDSGDAGRVVVVHSTVALGDETPVGTIDQYLDGVSSWPGTAHGQAWDLLMMSVDDPGMFLLGPDGLLIGFGYNATSDGIQLIHGGILDGSGAVFPFGPALGWDAFIDAVIRRNLQGAKGTSQIVRSRDPNAKTGPAGFDAPRYVRSDELLTYRIDFENDSGATAAAQEVFIADVLDGNFDLATLELTEVGFGNQLISIPAHRQYYQTAVEMTFNGQTFQVWIEAGLLSDTRQVFARFQSIDPSTSLPPDALTGFLPPEDGTGRGMGHVSYTIRPKSNLPTGAEIRNIALITFDVNEAIATNLVDPHDPSKGIDLAREAHITIDAGLPTSDVAALPSLLNSVFTVKWSGADDAGGSGLASFDVFVSDNDGPFTRWQSATTQTSARFTGQPGHTYRFYSQATDNVGLVESASPTADTVTQTGIHIWHNVLNSLDVTGTNGEVDGVIVAEDALAIINYLNAFGAGQIPAGALAGPPYYDTEGGPGNAGDDYVVAGDALAVINFLNAFGSGLPGPAGEGENTSAEPQAVASDLTLFDSVASVAGGCGQPLSNSATKHGGAMTTPVPMPRPPRRLPESHSLRRMADGTTDSNRTNHKNAWRSPAELNDELLELLASAADRRSDKRHGNR